MENHIQPYRKPDALTLTPDQKH